MNNCLPPENYIHMTFVSRKINWLPNVKRQSTMQFVFTCGYGNLSNRLQGTDGAKWIGIYTGHLSLVLPISYILQGLYSNGTHDLLSLQKILKFSAFSRKYSIPMFLIPNFSE